jgi:hypothetical protein
VRDILEVVEMFLKETAELELSVNSIDFIARLGRRRGQWAAYSCEMCVSCYASSSAEKDKN